MVSLRNQAKVGKYWDYSIENIKDSTPKEIKIITDYQKQVEQKVMNKEWTEEEYKKFSAIIKQVPVNDFIDFLDIYIVLLNLSMEEVLMELIHLIHNQIVFITSDEYSIPQLMAQAMGEISKKMLSFSRMPLTENEKGPYDSIEEKLNIYQQALIQLEDSNSTYNELFHDSFENWIRKSFKSDSLKTTVLAMESKLVERKIHVLKEEIKRIKAILSERGDVYGTYLKEQFTSNSDYQALKEKRLRFIYR